jgi:hypothetical protein
MQPQDLFPREEMGVAHQAAAEVIGGLSTMEPRARIALAVLLLTAVDSQDHPRDRAKLETVRDALCLVIDAIEPGLVEKVPGQ